MVFDWGLPCPRVGGAQMVRPIGEALLCCSRQVCEEAWAPGVLALKVILPWRTVTPLCPAALPESSPAWTSCLAACFADFCLLSLQDLRCHFQVGTSPEGAALQKVRGWHACREADVQEQVLSSPQGGARVRAVFRGAQAGGPQIQHRMALISWRARPTGQLSSQSPYCMYTHMHAHTHTNMPRKQTNLMRWLHVLP